MFQIINFLSQKRSFIHTFVFIMIHFLILVSRQGKVRLTKWYGDAVESTKQRDKMIREVSSMILSRSSKMCEFLEYGDRKIGKYIIIIYYNKY